MAELWRYYKIGVVNTAFGSLLYVLLVYLGLNLYVAQAVAHVVGMIFNYFMLRYHVFEGVRPRLVPYVASYAFNYAISLGFLNVAHLFIRNPYLAGVATMAVVSVINYFVLKVFVFKSRKILP